MTDRGDERTTPEMVDLQTNTVFEMTSFKRYITSLENWEAVSIRSRRKLVRIGEFERLLVKAGNVKKGG